MYKTTQKNYIYQQKLYIQYIRYSQTTLICTDSSLWSAWSTNVFLAWLTACPTWCRPLFASRVEHSTAIHGSFPSTVPNAVTRTRWSLGCCLRFSLISLRPFYVEVSSYLWSGAKSVLSAGGSEPAATSSLWIVSCLLVLYERIPTSFASWTSDGELYVSLGTMGHGSVITIYALIHMRIWAMNNKQLWMTSLNNINTHFTCKPFHDWYSIEKLMHIFLS